MGWHRVSYDQQMNGMFLKRRHSGCKSGLCSGDPRLQWQPFGSFSLKNRMTSFTMKVHEKLMLFPSSSRKSGWKEVIKMALRRADFAGSWYPGKEAECRRVIETFSKEAGPCPVEKGRIVGGIVPHAGWFYSGSIACNVVQCLGDQAGCDTCLVFGRHLHAASANYIMAEGGWETPLGPVEMDSEVATALIDEYAFSVETVTRYDQDNTIELQLPFIKYFLPETKIVPMGLPPVPLSVDIGRRAAEICVEKGRRTLVLGSTDLTHYGYNYGFVPKGTGETAVNWVKEVNDRRIVDLMKGMDAKGVIEESSENRNACCSGAAAAAISGARELGALHGRALIYKTSYDVRPDNSFVGYTGILFTR
jgi:MEMO1 family protein